MKNYHTVETWKDTISLRYNTYGIVASSVSEAEKEAKKVLYDKDVEKIREVRVLGPVENKETGKS